MDTIKKRKDTGQRKDKEKTLNGKREVRRT